MKDENETEREQERRGRKENEEEIATRRVWCDDGWMPSLKSALLTWSFFLFI